MKIKVLGAYGGEGIGFRTSSFLINDRIALEAGAITSSLSLRQQAKLNAIIISHTHLDHIHDIAFLADNVFGKRETPVEVIATEKSIRTLKKHFFNNKLWPDFTRIPDENHPTISLRAIKPNQEIKLEGLTIKAIPVNHPIPAVGYIISDSKSAFVYTGDTGITENLWKEANKQDNLKLVIIEVSFPNRLEELAKISGHLTPKLAQGEIAKLNQKPLQFRAFHMKPVFLREILKELSKLKPQIIPLEQEEVIEI